jgi:hypothetical protein
MIGANLHSFILVGILATFFRMLAGLLVRTPIGSVPLLGAGLRAAA